MPRPPGLAPILLVEDEQADISFVRRALTSGRILNPLVVRTDAKDAREYLQRAGRSGEIPVLAIFDIYLPGGATGLDLLHWMRTQPALVQLPVIILSVSTDRTEEARALSAGAAIVLHKPVTANLLVEAGAAFGLIEIPVEEGTQRGARLAARAGSGEP